MLNEVTDAKDLKLSRIPWGSWAQKRFCVPCFLFVGNRLHSPSMPSPEFQTAGSKVANKGKRQGRSSQETRAQPWGRVLVPPQGIHTAMWAALQILKPHQVGKVNCMLPTSTKTPGQLQLEGWWCWLPIISPPTDQKNLVRDKVIGKKWFYLERNTSETECEPSLKVRAAWKHKVVSFYGGG